MPRAWRHPSGRGGCRARRGCGLSTSPTRRSRPRSTSSAACSRPGTRASTSSGPAASACPPRSVRADGRPPAPAGTRRQWSEFDRSRRALIGFPFSRRGPGAGADQRTEEAMPIKKIEQAALDAWVAGMIGRGRVIGVQEKSGRFAFDAQAAGDLRLDYDVTLLPPKKYFLPQTEDLLTFRDGAYERPRRAGRSCSSACTPTTWSRSSRWTRSSPRATATSTTSRAARRRRSSCATCRRLGRTCSPAAWARPSLEEGGDVLLTRVDDDYVVESRSRKGRGPDAAACGRAGRRDAAT